MLQGEEASILTDETNSVLLLRNTNKPNSWEIFTFATTTQHTRQEWKTYLRYTCFYILFLILSSLLLSCKWNLLSTKLKWYLFGSIEEKSVLSNILFFFFLLLFFNRLAYYWFYSYFQSTKKVYVVKIRRKKKHLPINVILVYIKIPFRRLACGGRS